MDYDYYVNQKHSSYLHTKHRPYIALNAKIKTAGLWVVVKMKMSMHVITNRRIYLPLLPLP